MQKIRNENGKINKENRMGKDVDSALFRRNEKFYGYGKEKKKMKQEMIGGCIRLEFVFMGNRQSKGCIYRWSRSVRCRGVRFGERMCKRYMKSCVDMKGHDPFLQKKITFH